MAGSKTLHVPGLEGCAAELVLGHVGQRPGWIFFLLRAPFGQYGPVAAFELYLYTAVDSRPGPGGSRTTASCQPEAGRYRFATASAQRPGWICQMAFKRMERQFFPNHLERTRYQMERKKSFLHGDMLHKLSAANHASLFAGSFSVPVSLGSWLGVPWRASALAGVCCLVLCSLIKMNLKSHCFTCKTGSAEIHSRFLSSSLID